MDEIPYRLPLVIGATGHRDLREEDLPALRLAVREVIERLRRDYVCERPWFSSVPGLRILGQSLDSCPDPETPIIVLSSLAEGADRLIAREAMDLGAKLIAPLPMEPGEYRRDFAPERRLKAGAAEEFDRLKSEALAVPVMRMADSNTPENVDEDWRRALQYREVGLFIVRHCHVLIALWDGDVSNMAVGGTAEVVRFKRDGIPLDVATSVRASLDAPEMGPVIHILTPRAKSSAPDMDVRIDRWGTGFVDWYRKSRPRPDHAAGGTPAATGVQRSGEQLTAEVRERRQFESWEALATKAALTRRFNREAAKLEDSQRGKERLNNSLAELFTDPDKKLSGERAKTCAMQLIPHWCGLYQIADTLSQDRQKQFILDWRMLFTLGFAAIVCFEVGTHLLFSWKHVFWLIGLYTLFFFSVFGWFFYAREREHQERFLDYRALAEALRVAVFWKLVGIGWPTEKTSSSALSSTVDLNSPDAVADAYPIRQPSELDWVKTCLRSLELLDSGKSPANTNHRFHIEGDLWARTFWVNGQLEFFRKRGPARDERAEVFEKWSLALVIVSITFALLIFLVDAYVPDDVMVLGEHWNHENWGHRAAILLIGLLPGLAAVFTGHAERRALKAQARQYDRMRVVFQRAYDLLEASERQRFSLNRVLYAELGREAMEENAEWVAIYRQRPIRPPH
jgi:hypothetical protein